MEKVNRADKNAERGGQASHSVCEEKRRKGNKQNVHIKVV